MVCCGMLLLCREECCSLVEIRHSTMQHFVWNASSALRFAHGNGECYCVVCLSRLDKSIKVVARLVSAQPR